MLITIATMGAAQDGGGKTDFGFSLSPNYSFASDGAFSFGANVFIQRNATERFKLLVGLGLQNVRTKQTIDYTGVIPFAPGTDYPTGLVHNRYNILQIEMPLSGKFRIGERLYINSGVTLSRGLYVRYIYEDVDAGSTSVSKNSDKSYALYLNLGFGLDVIQNDNFVVFVNPYAQKRITSTSPLHIGLSTGVILK